MENENDGGLILLIGKTIYLIRDNYGTDFQTLYYSGTQPDLLIACTTCDWNLACQVNKK